MVGGLDFRDVDCKGQADFGFLKCHKRADFRSSIFDDLVIFNHATFSAESHFGHAEFSKSLLFQNATFGKTAEFIYSRFYSEAAFDAAEFCEDVLFLACQFDGFAKFYDAIFHEQLDLRDSIFSRPVNFRNASFRKRFPNLSGTILHEGAQFPAEDACWPDTAIAPPAEESRQSLAIIRHTVGKQGLPEEEHYFFRREMAFATRIGTPLQRLPYRLFGLFSDFGHSIAKPTVWLGVLWFIGFLFYSNWLLRLDEPFSATPAALTAAGFSVAQLFSFLGFNRVFFDGVAQQLPWCLQALAGVQAIAGVVLLFLLGLALRNRFRLK